MALEHNSPPQMPPGHIFRTRLNRSRALAAARYLLSRLGGRHNYTALLKLLFFADRYHIRNYVRAISTDHYVAMSKGPVASFLYDVFKGSYPDIEEFARSGYDVELRVADKVYDELAESDIEALEFSIKHFGRFDYGTLISISHEYPEWKRYVKRFDDDKDGYEPIFIEDFFDDPDPTNRIFRLLPFVDPFQTITKQEREELIEDVLDYSASIVPI